MTKTHRDGCKSKQAWQASATTPRRSWLVLLALGCGGGGATLVESAPVPVASTTSAGSSPAADPSVAGTVNTANTANAGAPTSLDSGDGFPTGPLRTDALEVLDRLCASCHAHGAAEGGLGDLDPSFLVKNHLLLPGNSQESPLLVRLRYGDSIPGHPDPGAIASDIAKLTRFIDATPGVQEACAPPAPQSFDELYAELLQDLSTRAAADRPFIRYVGLRTSRVCGSRRDALEVGLFDQLNGLSSRPELAVPATVGEPSEPQVFAIDLRAYGWNRPIDLDGDGQPEFTDGWEAVVSGAAPYALHFSGPEADELAAEMQTPVPFLSVNAFLDATQGHLYYALLGDPGYRDLIAALGETSPTSGTLARGGLAAASPKADRKITRYAPAGADGRVFWVLEETEPAGRVLEAPFESFAGGQVIYLLPNGMAAYALLTPSGTPVNELPACIGGYCPPRAKNLITCSECHAGLSGPGPGDSVRDFAAAHPENYDVETLAKIRQEFLPAEEFGGLFQADSASNLDAQQAAGSWLYSLPFAADAFAWSQPLTPELAAQEAGLSVDQLRELLPRLRTDGTESSPGTVSALQALGVDDGRIEREFFSAGFQQVLCARDGARNRPLNCP